MPCSPGVRGSCLELGWALGGGLAGQMGPVPPPLSVCAPLPSPQSPDTGASVEDVDMVLRVLPVLEKDSRLMPSTTSPRAQASHKNGSGGDGNVGGLVN